MRTIFKKTAAICMAFVIMLAMMPVLGTLTGGMLPAGEVYAEEQEVDVTTPDGFKFHLWIGSSGASVALRGYTGSATEIILPTSVTYGGKTYKASDEGFWIDKEAFSGNTKIKKVAVPHGYEAISEGAFKGCSSLTEIAIGDSVSYLSSDIFDDCSKLTTYYYSGTNITGSESAGVQAVINSGLGQYANGQPRSGVTVYTISGSVVDKAVQEINNGSTNGNKIKVVSSSDPYSLIKIESVGEDGTPYVRKIVTFQEKNKTGATFNSILASQSKYNRYGGDGVKVGGVYEDKVSQMNMVYDPSHPDADEFLRIKKIPLDDAIAQCVSGEIQDGKTLVGLLLARQVLSQRDMPMIGAGASVPRYNAVCAPREAK